MFPKARRGNIRPDTCLSNNNNNNNNKCPLCLQPLIINWNINGKSHNEVMTKDSPFNLIDSFICINTDNNINNTIWLHENCLFLNFQYKNEHPNGKKELNANNIINFIKNYEINVAVKIPNCYYCNEKSPTIRCNHTDCNHYYHLCCTIEDIIINNRVNINSKGYSFYCENHCAKSANTNTSILLSHHHSHSHSPFQLKIAEMKGSESPDQMNSIYNELSLLLKQLSNIANNDDRLKFVNEMIERCKEQSNFYKSKNEQPIAAVTGVNNTGKSFIINFLLYLTVVNNVKYIKSAIDYYFDPITREIDFERLDCQRDSTITKLDRLFQDIYDVNVSTIDIDNLTENELTQYKLNVNNQFNHHRSSLICQSYQLKTLGRFSKWHNHSLVERKDNTQCHRYQLTIQQSNILISDHLPQSQSKWEQAISDFNEKELLNNNKLTPWLLASKSASGVTTTLIHRLKYSIIWHLRIQYMTHIQAQTLVFKYFQMLYNYAINYSETDDGDSEDQHKLSLGATHRLMKCHYDVLVRLPINAFKWSSYRLNQDQINKIIEYDEKLAAFFSSQDSDNFDLSDDSDEIMAIKIEKCHWSFNESNQLLPPTTVSDVLLSPRFDSYFGRVEFFSGCGLNVDADRLYIQTMLDVHTQERITKHLILFVTIYLPCLIVENCELWDLPGFDIDPRNQYIISQCLYNTQISLVITNEKSLHTTGEAVAHAKQFIKDKLLPSVTTTNSTNTCHLAILTYPRGENNCYEEELAAADKIVQKSNNNTANTETTVTNDNNTYFENYCIRFRPQQGKSPKDSLYNKLLSKEQTSKVIRNEVVYSENRNHLSQLISDANKGYIHNKLDSEQMSKLLQQNITLAAVYPVLFTSLLIRKTSSQISNSTCIENNNKIVRMLKLLGMYEIIGLLYSPVLRNPARILEQFVHCESNATITHTTIVTRAISIMSHPAITTASTVQSSGNIDLSHSSVDIILNSILSVMNGELKEKWLNCMMDTLLKFENESSLCASLEKIEKLSQKQWLADKTKKPRDFYAMLNPLLDRYTLKVPTLQQLILEQTNTMKAQDLVWEILRSKYLVIIFEQMKKDCNETIIKVIMDSNKNSTPGNLSEISSAFNRKFDEEIKLILGDFHSPNTDDFGINDIALQTAFRTVLTSVIVDWLKLEFKRWTKNVNKADISKTRDEVCSKIPKLIHNAKEQFIKFQLRLRIIRTLHLLIDKLFGCNHIKANQDTIKSSVGLIIGNLFPGALKAPQTLISTTDNTDILSDHNKRTLTSLNEWNHLACNLLTKIQSITHAQLGQEVIEKLHCLPSISN